MVFSGKWCWWHEVLLWQPDQNWISCVNKLWNILYSTIKVYLNVIVNFIKFRILFVSTPWYEMSFKKFWTLPKILVFNQIIWLCGYFFGFVSIFWNCSIKTQTLTALKFPFKFYASLSHFLLYNHNFNHLKFYFLDLWK